MMDAIKPPMHSIEAEQSVLGGLLLNSATFDLIADTITDADFYRAEHRAIFRAISALVSEGQPADVVTTSETLKARGEKVEMSYLGQLANETPSTANIKAYAKVVRDKSVERQLASASMQIGEIAYGEGDTAHKVDRAQSIISAIAEEQTSGGPELAGTVLKRFVDQLDARMKKGGDLLGLSTGFKDLDRLTSGLSPSELIIVAGRPSMGKTAFAMNLAEQVAVNAKLPVLVFSMEMSSEQLVARSIASQGRIDLNKVLRGDMDSDEWKRMTQASAKLNTSKLIIDETPALTVLRLRAAARRQHREHKLGAIVVDYLQLMDGQGENRTSIVGEISRGLKALAKELSVPVIALSQLNRSLETRQNKRPVMSDLRESGAIEQDADLILFVYRDEVYDENSAAKGTAEIIIGKQRNGPLGTARLTFQGQFCRFENYTGGPIENVVRPKQWRGGMDYD
jgi:replicative DNA helicase